MNPMNRLTNPAAKSKSLSSFGSRRTGGGQRPSTTNSNKGRSLSSFSSSTRSRSIASSSMASSSSRQEAAAAPAGDDTMGEIIHWAGFVNVNEDMTRKLAAEIEEINDSTKQIDQGIKQETSVGTQLKKDSVYVNTELNDFVRKANDLQSSGAVTEQMHTAFEGQIQKHVLQPLQGSTRTETDMEVRDDPSTVDGRERLSNKKFLQYQGQQLQELAALTQDDTLQKIHLECQEIQEEIQHAEKTIVEEDLEAVLEQKKQEEQDNRRELEAIRQRKQETQVAIDTMRKNTAKHAQQITDQQKIKDANKKKFAEETEAKTQEVERVEAECRSLKTEEEWDKEIAEAQQYQQKVAKALAEAQRMIAAANAKKKEREAIESAILELEAANKDRNDKVDACKGAVEASQVLLADAIKEQEEVLAGKLANDKFEAETIVPAKAEMAEIVKQKDELAKKITETSAKMSQEAAKATKEEEEMTIELNDLKENTKDLEQKLEEKKKVLEGAKKRKAEEAAANAKSIEELQNLGKSLQEATQTVEAELRTAKKEDEEKNAASKAASEAALDEAVEARKEKEQHLQILEVGEKLLASADERVQKIEEAWKCREKEIEESSDEENLHPTKSVTAEEIQAEFDTFVDENLTTRP